MFFEDLLTRITNDCHEILEWSKCGDAAWSALPTVLWALGATALAQRLLGALFRRSLFRRVPCWELMLQHLLFAWLVLYSLYFWAVLVRLVKLLTDYINEQNAVSPAPAPLSPRGLYALQQVALWAAGAAPLALCVYTRPRPQPPPLMIWITASTRQRRELGPHGYYLQRPAPAPSPPPRAPRLRRAHSDSAVAQQQQHTTNTNKRYSKSI